MGIKLHSFFVLSLPSHLIETFFTTVSISTNLYLYTLQILDLLVICGYVLKDADLLAS